MKARMTQLDLFKVDLSDIKEAFIQNIYYANNAYYIKLNMRVNLHDNPTAATQPTADMRTFSVTNTSNTSNAIKGTLKENKGSRKRYLNIGATGVFLGEHEVGVNYFAKLMRKYLNRKCIKDTKVVKGGVQLYFHTPKVTSLCYTNNETNTEFISVNKPAPQDKETVTEAGLVKKPSSVAITKNTHPAISIKKELTKPERRALRKAKQANKSHVQSKNKVDSLLIENPHLKNIPVSDWKKHIEMKPHKKSNTVNEIKDNKITQVACPRASSLLITMSPFNVIIYDNCNILGSLKPVTDSNTNLLSTPNTTLSVEEKPSTDNNKVIHMTNAEDIINNIITFNDQTPVLSKEEVGTTFKTSASNIEEIFLYLKTAALFLSEKELNIGRLVSVLYEIHILNALKNNSIITNYRQFCKSFLLKYISYLKATNKGTAFYFKMDSFFVPFEFKNGEIDFLRTPDFTLFFEKYHIHYDVTNNINKEFLPFGSLHNKIDISIFNPPKSAKTNNNEKTDTLKLNMFDIKVTEYNNLLKDFFKITVPTKTVKKIKEELNIKGRAVLSLKVLEKKLCEVSSKMEYLEENTSKFETLLEFLNLNLLQSQIIGVVKRELGFSVEFNQEKRGVCVVGCAVEAENQSPKSSLGQKSEVIDTLPFDKLSLVDTPTVDNITHIDQKQPKHALVKYEINYFLDLNENLKKLYDEKRKIKAKINKTLKFIDETDFSKSKPKPLASKKHKFKQNKKALPKNIRNLFWFEKYKYLITPSYILVAGKNMKQNEELVKSHLNESLYYLHPLGTGPSVLVISNNIISFNNCFKCFSTNDKEEDAVVKRTAANFIALINQTKESFIVPSTQVSKTHLNEKAKMGAFFVEEPTEKLTGDKGSLLLTIGYIERSCRKCKLKGNVLYSTKSSTSVLFPFYCDNHVLNSNKNKWKQYISDVQIKTLIEGMEEPLTEKEKEEIQKYIITTRYYK